MERTGPRNIGRTVSRVARVARRLQAGWLLLAGTLALGGCVVVPAHPVYVAPAYVAPAPVYVVPAPTYGYRGYGWHRGHW
jgi:pheromone shutdown protein TraB